MIGRALVGLSFLASSALVGSWSLESSGADGVFNASGTALRAEAATSELSEVAPAELRSGACSTPCAGTSNPWAIGPSCCPGKAVIHPYQNTCDRNKNLSPRMDEHGRYLGARDRPNAIPVGPGTLQVCAVYIIDNGEGDGWPHGPYGNIYWDVFRADEPLASSRDGADRRRIQAPHVLRGPHNTHGRTDEWLDDEVMRYADFGLVNWSIYDRLVVRIWESDSMSEDGNWLGRRNDVLGMELVARSATTSPVWIPFHKYTNDHPRRRTSTIAAWMLLKTGGSCP